MRTTEVIIVGAGPTGLALGAELARQGVDALILDRLAEGRNTSRAAVVQARTLEVLDQLGVTERLLAVGLRVPIFRVREHGRVLSTISFCDLETRFPFTLMCPQDQTETILLERLRELGGCVQRPCTVSRVAQDESRVEVEYTGLERTETVEAQWLVACNGAHSTVREQCSMAFEGGTYDEDFVLADVEMQWPLGREEVTLFSSGKWLMVVAPLPSNRFRVVATTENASEIPSTEEVARLLAERGPGGEAFIHRLLWSSRFRVSHRLAQSFRNGRVLLAGDAAHVHSPAGGQGMNTGIQDAISLAETLPSVLRGGDASALDDWAAKRKRIAKSIVRMTDRMTKLATLSSPLGRTARDLLLGAFGQLPAAQHALARKLAELDNR